MVSERSSLYNSERLLRMCIFCANVAVSNSCISFDSISKSLIADGVFLASEKTAAGMRAPRPITSVKERDLDFCVHSMISWPKLWNSGCSATTLGSSPVFAMCSVQYSVKAAREALTALL